MACMTRWTGGKCFLQSKFCIVSRVCMAHVYCAFDPNTPFAIRIVTPCLFSNGLLSFMLTAPYLKSAHIIAACVTVLAHVLPAGRLYAMLTSHGLSSMSIGHACQLLLPYHLNINVLISAVLASRCPLKEQSIQVLLAAVESNQP